MSAEFVPVALVSDVASGSAATVTLDGRDVALFNISGTFYAIDNTCPHQGGPLAEGWIEGATVTCPWHAWCFRLDDGRLMLADDLEGVDAFAVRIDGETVSISRTPKLTAP